MAAEKTIQKAGRLQHLDFLRIIAIFMVLFNHTGTNGFVLFTIARESYLYGFYLFLAIFIKIAVPLFFMISGALLLSRGIDVYIVRKKFLKFLIILISCSLVTYLSFLRFNIHDFSLKYFITTIYSSNIDVAYWYLYSYIAYILLLPILSVLAQSLSNKQYIYMIIIYFLMQCLSIVQYIIWKGQLSYNGSFSLFIMGSNIFYPLLGYFIEERVPEKYYTKKVLALMACISVISIIICCLLTDYHCNLINEWSEATCQNFFGTLIFIPAATVYFAAKMWFASHRLSGNPGKILTIAGSCTFGIYLFEHIYRKVTSSIFTSLLPYLHTLPSCIIWILSACFLGTAVTIVLKKIPVIKKYI